MVVFFLLLIGFTFLMTMIWEVTLNQRVYHCTDSLPFGYLGPGDWVHGEVRSVETIPEDVLMSEPDSILVGWSESLLWGIWLMMFVSSVFLSLIGSWALTKNSAKGVFSRVALISVSFLGLGCDGAGRVDVEVQEMLKSLSEGAQASGYAGTYQSVVARLVEVRAAQEGDLVFEIKEGDVPELGDGSCEKHVLVSVDHVTDPILGLRLKRESEGWHIAGFWTP